MKTVQKEQPDIQNENPTLSEQIGKRLRKFRNNLGRTQLELASDLNVSDQSILRYEHGTCSIPLDLLESLHMNFHMDLNYLICGDAPSNNDAASHIIEDLQKLTKKYLSELDGQGIRK